MQKFIDLTGKRFGRLVVIKRVDNDKWGKSKWLCKCDCEDKNGIIVTCGNLRSGHTKSCGCLQRERTSTSKTKHGHRENGKITGIYRSWALMIQRCINSNNVGYHNYGERGITVCERWLNSFSNFLEDMGKSWKPGLTIERIKNEEGYCKKNCKWATRKQQGRNKRNNLYATLNGKTQLLIEWSEKTGIPYRILWERINKLGWSSEKALTTPIRKRRKKK